MRFKTIVNRYHRRQKEKIRDDNAHIPLVCFIEDVCTMRQMHRRTFDAGYSSYMNIMKHGKPNRYKARLLVISNHAYAA